MTDKFVIQCAGSKTSENSLRTPDGRLVKFVANPVLAPVSDGVINARPDDICENGKSWRELLAGVNESEENLEGLSAAYKLYKHPVYQGLVGKFGIDNVFILSAGWGLVRAGYLLPSYDITFSNAKNVENYAKRKKRDSYSDFSQIELAPDDRLFFIGGKDYQALFDKLTRNLQGKRFIFYNSNQASPLNGVEAIRYCPHRPIKTNWHYTLAKDVIEENFEY